jgi:hypothetical protein
MRESCTKTLGDCGDNNTKLGTYLRKNLIKLRVNFWKFEIAGQRLK